MKETQVKSFLYRHNNIYTLLCKQLISPDKLTLTLSSFYFAWCHGFTAHVILILLLLSFLLLLLLFVTAHKLELKLLNLCSAAKVPESNTSSECIVFITVDFVLKDEIGIAF